MQKYLRIRTQIAISLSNYNKTLKYKLIISGEVNNNNKKKGDARQVDST